MLVRRTRAIIMGKKNNTKFASKETPRDMIRTNSSTEITPYREALRGAWITQNEHLVDDLLDNKHYY